MFDKIKLKLNGYTKKDYLKLLYHFFLIVLGNVSLAFGTAAFLVPNNIVTGGISGIAIVVQSVFFKGTQVTDIVIFILNWTLFVIGLIFLGKKFSLQTLVSVIIYPIVYSLFVRVVKVDTFFHFALTNEEGMTKFLAAICGSVFVGLGCAVTFKGGGSTGGVDVITFIVQKYLKIKASITSFVIDAVIIVLGLFVFKDLAGSVIGVIGALVCALMIEKIFIGNSSTYKATIISEKYKEICEFVLNDLERGCTILEGTGAYSGEERKVLQVVFDRKEYTKLMDYIARVDKHAFVTIVLTHDVNGNGFNSFPRHKI